MRIWGIGAGWGGSSEGVVNLAMSVEEAKGELSDWVHMDGMPEDHPDVIAMRKAIQYASGPSDCPNCGYPSMHHLNDWTKSYKGIYNHGEKCSHCGVTQPYEQPVR